MLLTKSELVKLIKVETGESQKSIETVMGGLESVLRKALLMGYTVKITGVGVLTHTEIPPRGEHEGYDPYNKKHILVPAREGYNRPAFRVSQKLKKEMKARTLGNVF